MMEKHKVLLGAIHIVFGAFSVVGSLVTMAYITFSGGVVRDPETFYEIIKLVVFLGSVFLLIISIPGIIGGVGLLNHKAWARNLVLIVGFFYLFFIPVGTFLSMYTMLVLLRDQVALLFMSPLAVNQSGMLEVAYGKQASPGI